MKPNRPVILRVLAVSLVFALAQPASAWGPITQQSIVRAAAYVLSNDGRVPIVKLKDYVQQGAAVSDETLLANHPSFSVDPVGAIQREMSLLQAVRAEDRIDPYFAYRMGMLGKMVVQTVSPLTSASPSVRAAYYSDVDGAIQGVRLETSPRKLVDPRAYFNRVVLEARENDQTIALDYQSGGGFRGLARNTLSRDASRAVDAVADVWHTIFTREVDFVNLEPGKMREFMLGAMDFYLSNRRLAEAEDAYRRAASLGILDVDTRKEFADRFFDAGYEERAVEEYRMVLSEQPGRRDAIERIAQHYREVGDTFLERGNLEDARDAYAEAAGADRLNGEAQRMLFQVENQIADREARLKAAREGIERARALQTDAEIASARRNYANALARLTEARTLLLNVPDEFIAESQIAEATLLSVDSQIQTVRSDLIENAQTLSGSASGIGMREIAASYPSQSREGLESLMQRMFEERMAQLDNRLRSEPLVSR